MNPRFRRRGSAPRALPTLAGAAALLYGLLFGLHRRWGIDFWWWMEFNLAVLIVAAIVSDSEFRVSLAGDLRAGLVRNIEWGILAAVLLYVVFFAGNLLARRLFPFAAGGIQAVYQLRQEASFARILSLMVFWIGPGEEVFWRGYLQGSLARRFGAVSGYLMASALYAAVHLPSGNPMLVLAAAVCGLFWGWLYLRWGSIVLNAVSHTAWDIAVFLLFPFTGP
ncbi:MAG: type II CAAX endopeptidase family protein [Verrucomicrobiota bacterium]